MGRIFIAVENRAESAALLLLRDRIVQQLQAHHYEVIGVPDYLSTAHQIHWINDRTQPGDVALAVQRSASSATVYYIASNAQRQAQAELVLQAALRRVPQLSAPGTKPDTQSEVGSLAFCREVTVPSLLLCPDDQTAPGDRQTDDMALGIAEGVAAWSQSIAPVAPLPIQVNINGAMHDDDGILVEGNPYVSIDCVDQFGIDLPLTSAIRRISYRNLVYVRAVDLRDFNLSVGWDSHARTVSLRSALMICPTQIDRIMGRGSTSEVQLMMFLKSHYADGLTQFPELPRLYREEAVIEGVNYDIAFAQMCVETHFLRFSGAIKPEQNNFAGLGSSKDDAAGARFSTARLGIRAQIQHLKAYASNEPLVQAIADPRFTFVRRGVAPLVEQLSGRWSADPTYGSKIKSIVRRLYEFVDFL